MVTSKYLFKGRGIEEKLTGFIRNFFPSAYESTFKGGFVRVYEDSSYFNKKNYLVMIRLDNSEAEEGIIRVELIAGSGDDSGLLNGIFGSRDKSSAKDFARSLQDFCTDNFIHYEPV